MADRPPPHLRTPPRGPTSPGAATFLRNIRLSAPGSVQLFGLLTLIITGGVLLLFTGVTITAAVLVLIFFSPIIILSSPIWVPLSAVLIFTVVGLICLSGSAAAAVAAAAWIYRYFRGLHPIGSERVDYARSQIASTASHVKDYAREYGGYLQSKVKDAAPGA